MAETGTYLYAITRGEAAASLEDVRGVSDAPVRTLDQDGLAAAVSTVSLDEFGEEALRANLEDLGWLERVARAHNQVVGALAASGSVAPLRLATVYLDDDGVRRTLDERRDSIESTLARLDGRTECGIKAYLDDAAARSVPEDSATESGTAYLQRRRAETTQREEHERAAAATGEEIHAELAAVGVASRRHPAQDQRLGGYAGRMILNGAYLVERDRTGDLEAAVSRLESRLPSVRFELTGPWPPYSFAELENA
ncbi:MAG: GvpL/GvpF family gas vesicle protein [Streptosporangiales bacterium]